jgi:hypothetical protein
MHHRFQRWLMAILFIVLITPLMPAPAQAASTHTGHISTSHTSTLTQATSAFGMRASAPRTSGSVFPPCGPSNDGEIVVVGGNRYGCVCIATVANKPCSWVWRNIDASESRFSFLELDQGVEIWNGPKVTLYFQPDNNLVVYDENGHARWASNTVGKGNKALFQSDGNFVVYNGSGTATWASNTCCQSGNYLDVQADGNVVIYNSSNRAIWATNTSH